MTETAESPLVSADELLARIDEPRLRIADVRWYLGDGTRGRAEYAAGHIRGAIFVDLDRDLSAAHGPGRHPLPDPGAFAGRLGQLGFGDEHAIVVYDDAGGTVAARMWWMLDRLGHTDVRLLDGGLRAWLDAGSPLSVETPSPLRATLTLADDWSGTLDRADIVARGPELDLVDVRAPERYRGELEPVDRVPGHIPGARNVPTAELLGDDGRLLGPARLVALLQHPDAALTSPTVVSCGSGVNACFAALASRVAGLGDPLLYPGSYSDWSASGLPIATGAEPGAPASEEAG